MQFDFVAGSPTPKENPMTLVYMWPNLKVLSVRLFELMDPDIQRIISVYNRMYGQPKIFEGFR